MSILDDIREQYPQYQDVPDLKLAFAIKNKFYPDTPAPDFFRKAGLQDLVGLDQKYDPTEGMSGFQKFAAGAGKSVVDNLRGIGQLGAKALDIASLGQGNIDAQAAYDKLKQDQSQANAQDAPLMATRSGLAGNITGQALQAIAGGTALKGAGVLGNVLPNGYRAAAASGAAQGALQPLASDQTELSRLGNAGIGAGAGLLGQGAVNVIGAGVRGLKSAVAPLLDSGQQQVAANTLARFGGDAAASATPSNIPGVQATLAEQTGDAGLAQLQRALADSDPSIARQISEQQAQNNAARIGLLRQTAGSDADLSAAMSRRDALANIRYQQAFQDDSSQRAAREWSANQILQQAKQTADQASQKAYGLPISPNDAAQLASAQTSAQGILGASPRMIELAQRPALQRAIATAKTIAANQGYDIGDPISSLQGQHYIKMALDDALNTAQQQGIGKVEQSAIASTKKAFVQELERQNDSYRMARESFRQLSGPVNQIQVGQGLLNRVTSPQAGEFGQITDALGNPVITPDRFGNAVKSLDQIARDVTKQKQASAADILSSQQKSNISSLLDDLSRLKTANQVGKSAGSNTVQNLASQNLLGQVSQGLGLPGLAENGLLGRAVKPLDAIYKLFGTNDDIKQKIAGVLLNPQSAESQAIIAKMSKAQRSAVLNLVASGAGLVGQSTALGVSK